MPDLESEVGILAFRVSGDFADVADAVARMFEEGFVLETLYGGSEYVVEGDDNYYVEVREDDNVVWSN